MHRGNDDIGGGSSPAGREPRPVGVGVRPLAALAAEVQAAVAGFDPEVTTSHDCLDMVTVLSDLDRSVTAGLALAARRVAQTTLWEGRGHRSSAHWLAAVTKTTVGDAMRLLETAEVAENAPATMEALRNGALSTRQANAVGKAEAANPEAGAEMVKQATDTNASVKELEQHSAQIVNAASGDTETERAEKIRKERMFRIGSNGDGSSWARIYGPTAEIARLEAALKPIVNDIFQDARQQGHREPVEAYTFDALMALAARTASAESDDSHERDKIIIRADIRALDRGHVEQGEVCEIAGHGPIPVTEAWRAIDGGAFIAAILTDGTDISRVIHLGRRPTVLQRTALEWDTAGTCAIEGCTNHVQIEIDHVEDWARSHVTRYNELASLCKHHHHLKTNRGCTLGPRLSNGKRKLIPPAERSDGAEPNEQARPRQEPTGDDRARPEAPEAAADRPGPPSRQADQGDKGDQGDLFDTS